MKRTHQKFHYLHINFTEKYSFYSINCPSRTSRIKGSATLIHTIGEWKTILSWTIYIIHSQTSYETWLGTRFSDKSDIGVSIVLPLFPLSPRTATRTLFSTEKRNFVRIWFTTSLYLSPRLAEINSATLLWNFVASGPIPPVVEKIRGVNDPFST